MSDDKIRPDDKKTPKQADLLSDDDLQVVVGGSQSSGAGAGKVTFQPFTIRKEVDKTTP